MRYYLPPRQGPTYVLDKSALYSVGYRKEETAAEDVSLPVMTPDERDKEHHHAKGNPT